MDQANSNGTSELLLKKKQTFARRVSDMFKDGANSGPPLLFRHSSMQRIRHCCRNLNLLPYLLYSFDHSISHPVAVKVNYYLNIVVKHILQNMILLYTKIQTSILRVLSCDRKLLRSEQEEQMEQTEQKVQTEKEQSEETSTVFHERVDTKMKAKRTPFYLVLVIYLAPFVVTCQLVVVCCLLTVSKFTPGFIFLVTALLFLGVISIRIMFHNSVAFRQNKKEKMKVQ